MEDWFRVWKAFYFSERFKPVRAVFSEGGATISEGSSKAWLVTLFLTPACGMGFFSICLLF